MRFEVLLTMNVAHRLWYIILNDGLLSLRIRNTDSTYSHLIHLLGVHNCRSSAFFVIRDWCDPTQLIFKKIRQAAQTLNKSNDWRKSTFLFYAFWNAWNLSKRLCERRKKCPENSVRNCVCRLNGPISSVKSFSFNFAVLLRNNIVLFIFNMQKVLYAVYNLHKKRPYFV